jgi:hypothetical protein
MGVTTIDPGMQLAAALQAQLAAVRERARVPQRASAAGATAPPGAQTAGMAQRISAIDRGDPDRRRKAVRVYLESELAREFGAGLLNDPSLPQLLDAVQHRMQEDATTAAAVETVGELLLTRAA